jgi:Na+/melibiose symporter-like transporter
MIQEDSLNGHNAKSLGNLDYLKITILGFALTALWSSLQSIVLPLVLLGFVTESLKNTYLGLLTFAGLVLAMITQPIAGALSDRCTLVWGRRRPYVLLGNILALIFLPGIGLVTNYLGIFLIYCLLQISCNIAQAPYQAFIPDLVTQNKRGLASGVKGLLEILGGVTMIRLTAYFMNHYSKTDGEFWLWTTLGTLAAVLLFATIITVMTVRETRRTTIPKLSLLNLYKSYKIDLKLHRGFIWFLISRALLGIPGVMLQIFILYYLIDVVGIANPAGVTGDLMVIVGICLLASVYPAGRLSDRVGPKAIIIFSGFLGASGTLLLFFLHQYIYILLSGAILGIANGALLSSSWALATDLAVKGEEARYLGLTSLAMAGGSALARLVGPLIDFFNKINSGMGYQIMLLICFISFISGALLIIKVEPYESLRHCKINNRV